MAGLGDVLDFMKSVVGGEGGSLLKPPAREARKPAAQDTPTYARPTRTQSPPKSKNKPMAVDENYTFVRDNENDRREGYTPNSGKWYPYEVKGVGGKREFDIGYGHKLDGNKVQIDGKTYDVTNGLTDTQVNRLFRQDISKADQAASRYKRLNRNQQQALAEIFYQSGTNMKAYGPKAKKALDRYEKSGKQEDLDEFIYEAFDPVQGIGVKKAPGMAPHKGLQARVARRLKRFTAPVKD